MTARRDARHSVSHWKDDRETPCDQCGQYHDRPSDCETQTSLKSYQQGSGK
jgi:hypothetical protein